jgi:glutamate racemase
MTQQSPIGVFDSGVGGLSIAKTIHTLMPNENVIYIADHLYSPYGNKSTETLQQRTSLIIDYFVSRGCKAIVVACNTATVHTISYLRTLTNIPIIGVEPALKPASELSQTGVVGLLATEQTIKSQSLLALKSRFEDKVSVELVACPLFVELVEQGQLNSDVTQQAIKNYIHPLIEKGIDHLVLGCTHYAFLIPGINQCLAELKVSSVNIIEPSYPVCLELKRQLETRALLSDKTAEDDNRGQIEFYSSGQISAHSSGQYPDLSPDQEPTLNQNAKLSLNELFSLLWQQAVTVKNIQLSH